MLPTSCEKIKRTNGALRDWSELSRLLEELRASMSVDGAVPIRAKQRQIVPEYTFQEAPDIKRLGEVLVEAYMEKAAGHD